MCIGMVSIGVLGCRPARICRIGIDSVRESESLKGIDQTRRDFGVVQGFEGGRRGGFELRDHHKEGCGQCGPLEPVDFFWK